MIEFDRVTKIYNRDTYALDKVTLKIKKGEFIFLVGPVAPARALLSACCCAKSFLPKDEL